MTKTYKLFLTAVVAVAASISAMAQTTWVETAPANLATGDIVVIVDKASSTAMSNDKGTSAAPDAVETTLSSNSSTSVEASLQWVVSVSEGTYKFNVANTENYLYATNTNNGLRVGKNDNNAFIIENGFLKNKATSRYVGVYLSKPDWRCYTNTTGNIKDTEIAFYKKVVSGVVVADPIISASQTSFDESTTVNITAEDGAAIYYTTDGTTPTAESTAYTAAFDVIATTTVKAIAVKGGVSSSVASLTLTKLDNVTSMTFAEAYDWCIAKGTESKTHDGYVKITFENAKVLYADETAIYVRQGEKAMQFYGFPFSEKAVVANDVLNGTYAGQLQAYKGIPELSASTKITTAANVTVTNSEDVAAAISATVAEVEARTYICDLVELTNVTITKDGDYFWVNSGDNDVEVKVTNNLIPAEYTNKLYNVTAVVTATYKNEGVLTLLSCEYVSEVPTEPGVVTAVEGVNANLLDENAPIYNLQGQRVDKNAKGILIQNGKKVLVK